MVSGNYFVCTKVNHRREYHISYLRWSMQCLWWCTVTGLTKAAMVVVQRWSFVFGWVASGVIKM